MDLMDTRKQVDAIDNEIVALYKKRMNLTDQIANYNIKNGRKILDTEREQKKLRELEADAPNKFMRFEIRELYEQIMAAGRKRQYQIMAEKGNYYRPSFIEINSLVDDDPRVVYQGAAGSYSQAAMRKFFGRDVDNFSVETFRDAMIAIEEGSADYAVLPIDNSTAGMVGQNYDLLVQFENYIVGEQIIPIRHCLMGTEDAKIEKIKRVYSHAQSLMQCSRYLSEYPNWEQISMSNNAFAAQKIAEDGKADQAAIASEYAAETYGLKILEEGINQSDSNSTRFIVATNRKVFMKGANKITICIESAHSTGSLYHLLSHIIYNGLNMTKIESRPIEDRNWEYRFFIDFDGNLRDAAVRNALRGLRDEARYLKILGNYCT